MTLKEEIAAYRRWDDRNFWVGWLSAGFLLVLVFVEDRFPRWIFAVGSMLAGLGMAVHILGRFIIRWRWKPSRPAPSSTASQHERETPVTSRTQQGRP
jgi:hypothetical protein